MITVEELVAEAAYQYITAGVIGTDVMMALAAHGWDIDAFTDELDERF